MNFSNLTNTNTKNISRLNGQSDSSKKAANLKNPDGGPSFLKNELGVNSGNDNWVKSKFNVQEAKRKGELHTALEKEKHKSKLSNGLAKNEKSPENKKTDLGKLNQLQLIEHCMKEITEKSLASLPKDIKIQARKYPWLHSYPTKGSAERISDYFKDLSQAYEISPSKKSKDHFQENIKPALEKMALELEKKLSKNENQESRKILDSVRKAQCALAIQFDDTEALEKSMSPILRQGKNFDRVKLAEDITNVLTACAARNKPKCTAFLAVKLKSVPSHFWRKDSWARPILMATDPKINQILFSSIKEELKNKYFRQEFLKEIKEIDGELISKKYEERFREKGITNRFHIYLYEYEDDKKFKKQLLKMHEERLKDIEYKVYYSQNEET